MSPLTPLFKRGGLASVAATVLVVVGVSAPASAAVPAMILSSASGPSGGGNTIIATVPGSAMVFPAGGTLTVQFQSVTDGATSCSESTLPITQIVTSGATTTAGVQTVDPETVQRITARKLAIRVPSSSYPAFTAEGAQSSVNPGGLVVAGTQTFSRWNICVYDSESTRSSKLLAAAPYTLAARPSITSIVPASSSALGGQTITVSGTGFSTAATGLSGSIGGTPLTDIEVAESGDRFTAVTGPRIAAGGLALTVNTPGGRVSSLDPDNNGQPEDGDPATADAPITFDYINEINRIEPNAAPAGSTVILDVFGTGFSDLIFGSGGDPTSSDAHVFLVEDAYESSSNRGVAECNILIVVSDAELVCALDLAADRLDPQNSMPVPGSLIAEGAYILTVVANGDINAGPDAKPTIVSSGAAFTVNPANPAVP
jgi:hypothetical protein